MAAAGEVRLMMGEAVVHRRKVVVVAVPTRHLAVVGVVRPLQVVVSMK